MAALNDWEVADANNNAAPPDGWPENTMAYSDVNDTGRAVQGTMKRFFADINGSLDAAGAADVYTLTLNETGYTAYFDGLIFRCSIPAANTTTTPTINVNGVGAVTIVDSGGGALVAGQLETGGIYDFQYDGTNFRVGGGLGGALAGGSDTELQFNDGGVLNGMSEYVFDGDNLTINYTGSDYAIDFQPVGATARAINVNLVNPANASPIRVENDSGNSAFATGRGLLELNQRNTTAGGACLRILQDSASGLGAYGILIEADTSGSAAPAMLINQSGTSGSLQIVDTSSATTSAALTVSSNAAGHTAPSIQVNPNAANIGIEQTAGIVDFILADLQIGEFNENAESYTAATGTKNLDVSVSTYFYAAGALTGNTITFTFDNPPASDRVATITVELNDGDGATAINWPASVDWPGGVAPTLSSGIDIITFVTRDGGTTWLGFTGGLDFQ